MTQVHQPPALGWKTVRRRLKFHPTNDAALPSRRAGPRLARCEAVRGLALSGHPPAASSTGANRSGCPRNNPTPPRGALPTPPLINPAQNEPTTARSQPVTPRNPLQAPQPRTPAQNKPNSPSPIPAHPKTAKRSQPRPNPSSGCLAIWLLGVHSAALNLPAPPVVLTFPPRPLSFSVWLFRRDLRDFP
jgi:hypothetical protein